MGTHRRVAPGRAERIDEAKRVDGSRRLTRADERIVEKAPAPTSWAASCPGAIGAPSSHAWSIVWRRSNSAFPAVGPSA